MKIAWSRSIGTLLALMLATSGYSNAEILDKCSQVESQRVAMTVGLEGQAPEARFEREAQRWLQALAKIRRTSTRFLTTYSAAHTTRLWRRSSARTWLPATSRGCLWSRSSPMRPCPTAAAAYSEKENRVYLNNIILNTPLRAFAYLEEVGHYLDTMLNEHDTLSDEGEHFMRLVAGQSHRHSLRPETGTIVVDGRAIEVEFGWLDDVWDGIKKGAEKGAEWSWEQLESATDWTLGGIQDTWEYLKDNINWDCVTTNLLEVSGCAVCIAGVIAARGEGATLAGGKEIRQVWCVGAALAVARDCSRSGAAKTEATPVGRLRKELKMGTVLHKESLVRLYDDRDDRSADWQAFPMGIWDVHALVYIGNDRASSITIAPRLVARVCAEDGLRGDCFDFHQGQAERNWYWSRTSHRTLNNRMSSLSVTPGVTVYQHSNFNGKSWTYTPGNYKHIDFLNDQLSSFITAPGIWVRFCAESGGWGDCYTVKGDEKSTVPSRMNDRISNNGLAVAAWQVMPLGQIAQRRPKVQSRDEYEWPRDEQDAVLFDESVEVPI
jgi:hypothetical protein